MYIDVLAVYEWLLCYLCVESHRKVQRELYRKKVSTLHGSPRNETRQVSVSYRMGSRPERTARCSTVTPSALSFWRCTHTHCHYYTLCHSLLTPSSWCIQYLVVKWFSEFVEEAREEGGGIHPVLCRLAALYGVWSLHRHSTLLYEGC